ncbi:MAG: DUF2268 domain-containing protein [Eubacteriaceae bacterium]|nr:DUF2268 domain-containing protein [Eubacteriaceae bacterium]
MHITLLFPQKTLQKYAEAAKATPAPHGSLWKEALAPYFEKLTCYAPYDMSERFPDPPGDIAKFEVSLETLASLGAEKLLKGFEIISRRLVKEDEDTIYVLLLPGENRAVLSEQNGVVGTSFFGNILIEADPDGKDYEKWIDYVFAHEYHHSVWGDHWYVKHPGKAADNLLTQLVSEGQADLFAMSFFENVKPSWLFGIGESELREVWEKHYKPNLLKTDYDRRRFILGDGLEIPRFAGYALGYRLAKGVMEQRGLGFGGLMKLNPNEFVPAHTDKFLP